MAYGKRNGRKDVSGNGNDSSVANVDGWNPNYLTLREMAVDYPVEETSPPPVELPDFRIRKIDYHCEQCGESLNVYTTLTGEEEAGIWLRWTLRHSHTLDD